jgi:hypothetical protein
MPLKANVGANRKVTDDRRIIEKFDTRDPSH